MRIHVVGAAIARARRCLVTQRSALMREPLRWEFPGGKVEPGERPEEALVREIREELGLIVATEGHLATGHGHNPSGDLIVLDLYGATIVEGELALREHAASAWLGPSELGRLDWAPADAPLVPAIVAWLERRAV
jgi:8-oxo-dGTP diphosphatase